MEHPHWNSGLSNWDVNTEGGEAGWDPRIQVFGKVNMPRRTVWEEREGEVERKGEGE